MNWWLAVGVVVLLCVYFAVEIGWGGSRGDFVGYRRPRDPLWPRWWRRGLYPPEPRDDGGRPVKPSPTRSPEPVE